MPSRAPSYQSLSTTSAQLGVGAVVTVPVARTPTIDSRASVIPGYPWLFLRGGNIRQTEQHGGSTGGRGYPLALSADDHACLQAVPPDPARGAGRRRGGVA